MGRSQKSGRRLSGWGCDMEAQLLFRMAPTVLCRYCGLFCRAALFPGMENGIMGLIDMVF